MLRASRGQLGFPQDNACLYNSMIYPLRTVPFTAIVWYQGESDAWTPNYYARCFPAMITAWR